MKKFWIVLIALGLVAAFSISASAADVKFSGSYYVEGWYDDNHSLLDKADTSTIQGRGGISLYHQRLRMQTDFKVAEGLSLTTRFDALEKNWGDRRDRSASSTGSAGVNTLASVEASSRNFNSINSSTNASGATPSTAGAGVTTVQEQSDIEFERVYITANLPFAQLIVGYADDIAWGTDFGDTHGTRPQIKVIVPIGPVTLVAVAKKDIEGTMYNGYGYINSSDKDIYDLGGIAKWKSGEGGVLFEYMVNNQYKTTTTASAASNLLAVEPYFKQTIGPVYLEGEAYYATGDYRKYDNTDVGNSKVETWGFSLHARVDLKPVYFGARFIYMLGDDPGTTDKVEGGIAAAMVTGQGFLPCLMLFNDSFYTATGTGYAGRAPQNATSPVYYQFMDNVVFFQGYAGVKPIDKLDIFASATYATAEKKPSTAFVGDNYGTELDLTATYKIYDNLSYMVGFGFLITGDYFKGTDPNAKISNDYIVMNRIALTF
jgi:hypothetical protein